MRALLAALIGTVLLAGACGSTFDPDAYRERKPPTPTPTNCGLQLGSPCCFEGPNYYTCAPGLLCNRDKLCGEYPDLAPGPEGVDGGGSDASMMSKPDMRIAPDLSVCSPPGGACILDTDCCATMGWTAKCGMAQANRCCRFPTGSPQQLQCG